MAANMIDTLRGMGRVKLAIMALTAMALIAAFTMIAVRVSSPALSPLFAELSPEDAAKITTELGKLGVPFDLQNNGGTIMVPSERVLRLRMTMAERGLPSNGSVVGYEIFDKSETFGSSNFVMNVNMVRALEGELARTIGSFQQVESARVHLVIPKRELFTKERQEPSASVALKLRGGLELSKGEVASITHFVAAGVPGLSVSRITVVDSYGRLLARGDGEKSVGAIAEASEDYRVNFETRTRAMLEDLVEKVVGPGKVRVQVAADINFDRVVIDSEKFDPEGQVARSVQSTSERENAEDAAQKDNVTVANQLPGAQGASGDGAKSLRNTEKSDETTNFEISKTTQKHIKEGGSVNRLSVAVLVDGNYTESEGGEKTYAPRDEEELKRIESLVRSAIVFDEKRGDTVEVVNMRFTQPTVDEQETSFLDSFRHEMEGIIQTLIIAGVAVLAIMVVLRPAIIYMMRTTGQPAQGGGAADGMAELTAPVNPIALPLPGAQASGGGGAPEEAEDTMVDLQNVKGRIRSSTLRKVVDVVDKNPEEAMNVMRQWMMKEAM